jgi:hypothetical protein
VIIRYRTGPDGQRLCPAPVCAHITNVKDPDAHLAWHIARVTRRMQQQADAERRRWLVQRFADRKLTGMNR